MSHYLLHHPGYHSNDMVVTSASGSYLHLADGRRLFDAGLAAGSQILGHNYPTVTQALLSQIPHGLLFLNNNQQIHHLAEKLTACVPTPLKHFVFCNSGSEATQRALRYARAATGRNKIACFAGGWHGMNEWTLLDDGGRFDCVTAKQPDGIPASILSHTLLLPYNDERAFELLEHHKNDLAAICIEPIQGSNPRSDIVPFLTELEARCKTHGILIIYDEIITGFRLSLGGASSAWQLKPDIVTYGKILGGGLPIGLVCFTDDVASQTFLDNTKRMLSGGTFSANPLMAATATAVLNCLQQADFSLLNDMAEQFRNATNQKIDKLNIPCAMAGAGSINRLYFTNKPVRNRAQRDALEAPHTVQREFRNIMLERGILWPTNGIIFNGFCHTQAELDHLSDNIVAALSISMEPSNG